MRSRTSADLISAGKLIAVTRFELVTYRVHIQLPLSPQSVDQRRAKCSLVLGSLGAMSHDNGSVFRIHRSAKFDGPSRVVRR